MNTKKYKKLQKNMGRPSLWAIVVAIAMSFLLVTCAGINNINNSSSGAPAPVVYIVDGNLFTTPINGGANIQLNTDSRIGNNVQSFLISPDNKQVVYRSSTTAADTVFELWSVPITGGDSIRLNTAITVTGANVETGFAMSPNSARVVYRADIVANDDFAIYSNLIGGGTPIPLNGTIVSGGDVHSFAISRDSTRVVYIADATMNDRLELYSAPIATATRPITLNGAIASGGNVSSFAISADSRRVVYIADATTNDVVELYSAPIATAASPITLNGTIASGGDVFEFAISPDNTRVVYTADATTNDVIEIYSAAIATAASPITLNGTIVSGGAVGIDSFAISPDSMRVVYRADATTDTVAELYSAPIATAASPITLNGALVTAELSGVTRTLGDVSSFAISPDSRRVVYTADATMNDVFELYSAPITTAASPITLNGTLTTGQNVGNFAIGN